MNPLESQLLYPLADQIPAPGAWIDVAPGLRWLRMGLPFALDHINLWLVRGASGTAADARPGWTVIDCGIDNDATRASWETFFRDGLDGLPVLRVIVTHCHPDHAGLAHWLCERWEAPLWMTAGEYGFARMMSAGLPGVDGTTMLSHFERHGVTDPATLEQLRVRRHYYPTLVPAVPQAYARMQDGQRLRIGDHEWQVITGFGHSPEHASLWCERLNLLVAGDMVLPRISTNVSVFAVEPEASPVQLFLDSLKKFRALPDDVLVLPSHGKPFRGLHTRIAQLEDHHRARLEEVLAACIVPRSAADIVPVMFRRALDGHQLTFALGEALAHLHKLWYDGRLRRECGSDGILRFRTA